MVSVTVVLVITDVMGNLVGVHAMMNVIHNQDLALVIEHVMGSKLAWSVMDVIYTLNANVIKHVISNHVLNVIKQTTQQSRYK